MDPYTEGCRCGVNSKSPEHKSCADVEGQRKSRCPCKKAKTACNLLCSCKKCSNRVGCRPEQADQSSKEIKTRQPRKRSYQQSRTTTYLEAIGSDIPNGRWTDCETLTLVMLSNFILKTELPFDVHYLCSFYELFRGYICNKQLLNEVPINAKEPRQIMAKYNHIRIHNY